MTAAPPLTAESARAVVEGLQRSWAGQGWPLGWAGAAVLESVDLGAAPCGCAVARFVFAAPQGGRWGWEWEVPEPGSMQVWPALLSFDLEHDLEAGAVPRPDPGGRLRWAAHLCGGEG